MNRFQVILQQLLSQYRRETILGGIGIGGALLIFGLGWFVLNVVFAPPIPELKTASVDEVANFLSHKRGLARLPIPQRRQVFFDTMAYYGKDATRGNLLARRLVRMAPSERAVIREAVFDILKEDFLNDAEQYNKLPESEKEKFIEEKSKQYESSRASLRGGAGGDGGENMTKIAEAFLNDPGVPRNSDQFTKALVTRTSPRDRAMAKPLLDGLSKAHEQHRRQGKAPGRKAG